MKPRKTSGPGGRVPRHTLLLQWSRGGEAAEDEWHSKHRALATLALQWSRGGEAAEDVTGEPHVVIEAMVLQWSRGGEAAEDLPKLTELVEAVQASMEPRR